MKKNLIIKLILSLMILAVIIIIGILIYKNVTNIDEFNKYIEIQDTSNLNGFETKENGNTTIYAKKAKLQEYIGQAQLKRYTSDNSYISNDFKIILANKTEMDIKAKIDDFVTKCKDYVDCKQQEVNLYFEMNQGEKLKDTSLVEQVLNEGKVINYTFQKEQKLYIIRIYQENENVIAVFSFNGIMPKAKTPEELTEEDKLKSTEKMELIYNNNENGIG